MGDFLELGLEGADKLIDKHFDKVPDKYIHSDTYKPHRFRKGSKDSENSDQYHQYHQQHQQSKKRRGSSPERREYFNREGERRYPRSSSPPDLDMGDNNGRPRDNGNSTIYTQDGPFITPPFTTLPNYQGQPHSTSSPQFSPRDSRPRQDYDHYATFPPPPSNYTTTTQQRPTQIRRRSSSYHGPRQNGFYSSDSEDDDDRYYMRGANNPHNQLATRNHNTTTSSHTKSHNNHHDRDFTENIKDQFTDSKEGLAGGAIGAIVGGYVTHKALESRGKDRGNTEKAWTLLGAAVGGLAVNAVVDKWEDKKKKEDGKNRERERGRDRRDSWGGEKGRERARSERGGGRRGYDDDDDYDERDRRYYR